MLWSLTKALLLFVLAGPLVGLAGFLVQEPMTAEIIHPALLVLFAYWFGAAPALVTGLAAWAFHGKLGRYSGGFVCGAVGALASLIFRSLPGNTMDLKSTADWLSLAQLWVIPGAVAGLICGLVYFWSPQSFFSREPRRTATGHGSA